MTPDQIRNLPHSGLCNAPRGALCTCGAGLLKLMAGAR